MSSPGRTSDDVGAPAQADVRVALFGATFDTGNLGVSALLDATLTGLADRLPGVDVTIFDHAPGCGTSEIVRGGRRVAYRHCGARWSKRVYRRHTLGNIRWSARFGGLWNEAARRVLASHAVLDISGGDSFTDLYGLWRLKHVNLPKRIALENGLPLILLPQTYGPFRGRGPRAEAESIVRRSSLAWARDDRSFDVLRDLLGDAYDPDRHCAGVDVAFLLETRRPAGPDARRVEEWIARGGGAPLAGLNVSGLLRNREDRARERFGLRADYAAAVGLLLERLVGEGGARVLLVPHVLGHGAQGESDVDACEAALARLPERLRERCLVVPARFDQNEIKWIISRCDWFCGTRMHATIAALSSGVPASAVSYSPKTLGVFETCGRGGEVADPTELTTGAVADLLWDSWLRRQPGRDALAAALPAVTARARAQMDRIADFCRARAGLGGVAGPRGREPGPSLADAPHGGPVGARSS